jgi:hypothetical protein
MVTVLHSSLQALEHGITLEATYNIFDEWLEAGHNAVEFVNIILEIYKASGLIPNVETTTEGNEKNA